MISVTASDKTIFPLQYTPFIKMSTPKDKGLALAVSKSILHQASIELICIIERLLQPENAASSIEITVEGIAMLSIVEQL